MSRAWANFDRLISKQFCRDKGEEGAPVSARSCTVNLLPACRSARRNFQAYSWMLPMASLTHGGRATKAWLLSSSWTNSVGPFLHQSSSSKDTLTEHKTWPTHTIIVGICMIAAYQVMQFFLLKPFDYWLLEPFPWLVFIRHLVWTGTGHWHLHIMSPLNMSQYQPPMPLKVSQHEMAIRCSLNWRWAWFKVYRLPTGMCTETHGPCMR